MKTSKIMSITNKDDDKKKLHECNVDSVNYELHTRIILKEEYRMCLLI